MALNKVFRTESERRTHKNPNHYNHHNNSIKQQEYL